MTTINSSGIAWRLLTALLATSSICHAATFTLVRKDAIGVSSFNTGTNWNVIAAPAANNTYSTNGYSLRTPPNNAAHTFAGDSLTVPPATDGDSGIIFKGTAGTLITVPDLILSGGRGLGNGNSPVTQTLDGNITVTADTNIDCGSNATFHLSADFISGTGSFGMVNVGAATTLSTLRLSGTNTGWTGKLAATLADPAKRFVLEASSETNLGGNPPTFAADQLTLGSATFRPLASFTIDDPNRGIRMDTNGGTFETATGIQLNIATPISGPGNLSKTGAGTLVLSATNTHTGTTSVTDGTLSLTGSGSIATSPSVTIASAATLDVLSHAEGKLTLAPSQTIQGAGTVNGSVVMASTSNFAYRTVAGAGTEAALLVQGDLTLDGNLQVTGIETLADGNYTFPLIRYTGSLTNLTLDTSSLPATFIGNIVIDAANKQVNLTGTKNCNAWLPTATTLNSRATIIWTAIPGATSYNIKRATSPAGPFVTLNNLTASPYTDAPLINGTTYYYQIAAVNAGLETATSNTVSVTPAITTGTPAMMFGDSVRLKRPFAKDPTVVRFGGRYLMYYSQKNASNQWSAGIAESTNLVDWSRVGEFLPGTTGPDKNGLAAPCGRVVNGKVELFYQSYTGAPSDRICNATSTDGLTFTRNPANPIFGPSGAWNNGRAIDADYIEYNGRMILSCATRDTMNTVQQVVVADAPIGTDFSSGVWTMLTPAAATFPPIQTSWEQKCIEGQTMCVRNNKLFMFYGGAYNNAPQQIGVASSTDGANWTRLPSLAGNPFFPDGAAGTWNASESGHPGIFIDDDDQTYMFYQGNNDGGNTWFLSVLKIGWNGDVPYIKPGIARITDRTVPLGTATSAAIALMIPVPDANTLTLTATSSNPALIPASNLAFTGTGCGRVLTATPAANIAGITTITVTATDTSGRSDATSYQLTIGTPGEIWRQQWFGSPSAAGNAADHADPDNDDRNNLMEFATGTPPDSPNGSITGCNRNGNTIEFTYPRSHAAVADGVAFIVEWSDALGNDWSDAGVIQIPVPDADNGTSQTIRATISLPPGNPSRFVRLRVIHP